MKCNPASGWHAIWSLRQPERLKVPKIHLRPFVIFQTSYSSLRHKLEILLSTNKLHLNTYQFQYRKTPDLASSKLLYHNGFERILSRGIRHSCSTKRYHHYFVSPAYAEKFVGVVWTKDYWILCWFFVLDSWHISIHTWPENRFFNIPVLVGQTDVLTSATRGESVLFKYSSNYCKSPVRRCFRCFQPSSCSITHAIDKNVCSFWKREVDVILLFCFHSVSFNS